MIKINKDWTIEQDNTGYKLHHFSDGKDKEGNDKRMCVTNYHPSISAALRYAADRVAGEVVVGGINDAISQIEKLKTDIHNMVKEL